METQYGAMQGQSGAQEPAMMTEQKAAPAALPVRRVIGEEQVREAILTLKKYQDGKKKLEARIIEDENWWKLRQWRHFRGGKQDDDKWNSAWLFNCIMGKHADAIAAYPEPAVRPREENDREEAKALTSILPVILEQNDFEETYSAEVWQKMKQGTGMIGVFWDKDRAGGLGDICIRRVDMLSLFWEPGITDIQASKNVFAVTLMDNDTLAQLYPQLKDKLKSDAVTLQTYPYEDNVDTSDKSAVVDWYYKKYQDGKTVLHYVKFCGETVLYATENDTEAPTMTQTQADPETGEAVTVEVPTKPAPAEAGLYDDGDYPFVVDPLFPSEGTITGFGYIDLEKDTQEQIDRLNAAIVKTAEMGARPRWFINSGGAINEAEFADWNKPFVHVDGNMAKDSLLQVAVNPVSGSYLEILNQKIEELKWTSGNTDMSNGTSAAGVTAASAIAALQESAGRSSRASNKAAYRAYARMIRMVIERIRQFYDMPRKFRILGQRGAEEYITYTNQNLQPQAQGTDFGTDMGYRLPVFDIQVAAQKKSEYTALAQNELALQFFNLGFFNPQMTDQALSTMDMMDFDGKDTVTQKIAQNGEMAQRLAQWQQMALSLAQTYAPDMAEGLSQAILSGRTDAMPQAKGPATMPKAQDAAAGTPAEEDKNVADARERTKTAAMPK
jgi:hypothetical protein